MLSFYHSMDDYVSAVKFLPKRFNGRFGLLELSFAWDIWTELGDEDSMRRHLKRFVDWAWHADQPLARSILLANLGDYFLRMGEWRAASECYQEIRADSANAHQAVLGPVLALAGELWAACKDAHETLRLFKTYDDPDAEVPAAANEREMHRDIEKQLNAIQRGLGRVLGKKRLKKLGASDS
jgi:tetratricopeptide (TPR) repeat protein